MLALAEVEEGHNGGLLVLRRVPLENLGDDGLVLLVELEGDVGIVVRSVAVLEDGTGQLRMSSLEIASTGIKR